MRGDWAVSRWLTLLRQPEELRDSDRLEGWFGRIAERLLNGARLLAGGEQLQFAEVEFYYFAAGHPDPFTHRDVLQRACGPWYFHRTRGAYRGGSFKGLDLTFGDGSAFGGVLIRSLEAAGGALIDGPSLCVDHLLSRAGFGSVAALDERIGGRAAWDAGSPLALEWADELEARRVFQSPRVGLSLCRAVQMPEPVPYVMRPYRYLTEPRRIRKGKVLLVLALHAGGADDDAINRLTGCPLRTVRRYVAEFEAGRRTDDIDRYRGLDPRPPELCRLYGAWWAQQRG
jgi:hypothetical protein